ncbi:MAG: hypothetical protein OEL53_17625 [Rhodospirillales bacterium]|nr:hypothetical protein [Rhodospirillales bacterium]
MQGRLWRKRAAVSAWEKQAVDCRFSCQTLFALALNREKVNSFSARNRLNFHAIANPYLSGKVSSLWRKGATEKGFWGKSGPDRAAKVKGQRQKTVPKLGFSGPSRQARECLEKAIGGGKKAGNEPSPLMNRRVKHAS